MPQSDFSIDTVATGSAMWNLMQSLYPLHRSIAGPGLRQTLQVLRRHVPIAVHEIPTRSRVYDWEVPAEWEVRDAYVADRHGRRWIDYRQCNLHVMSHSQPVRRQMSWEELQPHLHSLPDQPDWIPYRTAFFREDWGFCATHRQLHAMQQLSDEVFEVVIDADFKSGALSLGELVLPGSERDECLIHVHTCHPSLADDNLSGIVVASFLANHLAQRPRRWTYRFVFAPATIGAITWLWMRQGDLASIRAGLVLSLLGNEGPFHYKRSRQESSFIDRACGHVLRQRGMADNVLPFSPMGYDERQFNSPGFQLPVGLLTRTPHGQFPEYHTSGDNCEFIAPERLGESLQCCLDVLEVLECNAAYENQCPYGEPMLGRRGLYQAFGQHASRGTLQKALLWVLNGSDGKHDLLQIAVRADLPFTIVRQAAELLHEHELLRRLPDTKSESSS
jgi:aminopeptidase-like protein